MKKIFSLFVVLLCGVFCLHVSAAEPKTKKIILDNGLTVLLNEMPSSTTLAIYALVQTGSATEEEYSGSGISHFVEHMLFKGTEKRAVGEVSQEVRALGGQINASTSFDYTMYTLDLPSGTLGKGVDLMADMLINSKFDPQQVEKERDVIFGEMRLYNDNPDRQLNKMLFETAYVRHPYRHPIIGYESLFARITRDNLYQYYKERYIPNNIIFSVAGAFDSEKGLELIQELFKDFAPRAYRDRNLVAEPDQIAPRFVETDYPTELTRMSMVYQGVSILDLDMVALDVLSMILGQGQSSRLYLDVYKNKGLVYSISSGNYTPMDRGLFEIETLLDEKNIESTLTAVKAQIAFIQKKGVETKELAKAKRQVLSGYTFGKQTPGGVAYEAAINQAYLGDPDFSQKYIESVNQITSQDIQKAAAHYLIDQRLTVVVVKPRKEGKMENLKTDSQKPAAIEKITLDNGLTILLKADPAFPIVSIQLSMNGGTRRETEKNNGLGELLSSVWVKGTKTRSAEGIASLVESLGGSLDGFSGRNSFGLSLNILAEDLLTGLDLLEDLVKNPSFPEKEFLKSQELQKAAIHARDDNISSVTSKAMRETLFLTHPFRLETIGTLESLQALRRDDVLKYYQELGVPNNMVLAVFGDFDQDKVLSDLKKRFSALTPKPVTLPVQSEEPPSQLREKTIRMPKEQAMVMIGFQGPKVSDPDRYGLEMISSLLGSSLNGRIFMKIRDELGESYTLGGGYTPGVDAGVVSFYVLTTDESLEKVKDLLLSQIEQLQTEDISDEELLNTQAYIIGTFKMGIETNASLAFMTSLDELYGLGYENYKKLEESIRAVTKDDIKRLATQYLDRRKAAVVLTRPEVGFKTPAPTNPAPQSNSDLQQVH